MENRYSELFDFVEVSPSDLGVSLFVSNDYGGLSKDVEEMFHTHKGSECMMKLFEENFMYKVYQRKNISQKEFINCCKQLAEFRYPQHCRRIFVYFAGHGGEGTLLSQNGELISVDDMLQLFKPNIANNPSLVNIAKLFFIDACRGNRRDSGYYLITQNLVVQKSPLDFIRVPTVANFFVAYASSCGFVSYGDLAGGCWTQNLIQALQESKVEDNIFTVLTTACKAVTQDTDNGQYLQTPQFISSLTEEVHFKREALQLKWKFGPGKF